ncbi:MAG: hypothetical protein N2423_03050 [Novosphingobium sp.]|nr:hypothetical protein [Novosphingobium sp.]
MNAKTFSNTVIAIGAIALVAIPVTNAMAQTQPNSWQAARTIQVPASQRQIFSPQARQNIRIAPGALPVRQPATPVANTGNSRGYTPPTIRNPYPNSPRLLPAAGVPTPSGGQAASLTSSGGAIGNRIGIAVQPNLPAPVLLIFSTGGVVPANINSRVIRDSRGFYTLVPAQLCFNNVQNWVVKLQLADGRLIDPVGYFARPTNCP